MTTPAGRRKRGIKRTILNPTGRRGGVRGLFIEPYRQVKLGLMFLAVNFTFAALIFAVFGYYVWDMYTAVSSYFQLTQSQNAMALTKFSIPILVGAALLLLFIATTILISVKYTHEIYGPLVQIHRFLDEFLESKRPGPLHLRESDQLKDLASKLNTMAEIMYTDKRKDTVMPVYRFVDELLAGKNPADIHIRGADDSNEMRVLAEKLNQLAALIREGEAT
jgi:hypothetical protein